MINHRPSLLRAKSRGHILAFMLVILGVLLILTAIALNLVTYERVSVQRSYQNKQAVYLAEAGIDQAIRQLNANANFAGESVTLGEGVFTTSVSGSGSNRTIESTGYIPEATNPQSTKKIKVEASLGGTALEFFYGIQVGGGGLTMTNSAQVIGNVFSNGNITGSNSASITGDAIVAGGISDNPTLEYPAGCTTTCGNADQFFATASTNRDIAQSFTATATGALPKVSVFLAKVGAPSSNISVRIATDVSGRPNTSSLATGTIAYTSVGAAASWIDVTFSSPANLTNGAKYWIVLDYGSNNAANYWNWRKDSTDAYANNTGRYTGNCCTGSPIWTNVGGDLAFRAWIGGSVTQISGMTIGNSSSGTGRANQFTNTTIHGSSCPNQYCIVENPAPQALPISDGVIADWKSDAEAGGTNNGDYNLSGSQTASLGPKKITGNLILSNQAVLTITGTIWVTGNINLSNESRVLLDSGYGANSGVLLNDGIITISNGITVQGAGVGSYVLMLSARDAPTATSISVSNSSTAVIYYAGKSQIQFSNQAAAKEATAWGINMSNSATVTYESGLADALFSSGPGGGWIVKAGSWRESN